MVTDKVPRGAVIFYLQPTTPLDPEVQRTPGFEVHCNEEGALWSPLVKMVTDGVPQEGPFRPFIKNGDGWVAIDALIVRLFNFNQ